MKKTMLIVFGGLPGVDKTTLAEAVARELEPVYLFALRRQSRQAHSADALLPLTTRAHSVWGLPPGLGFLLRFFNVSFSKRFVWGSRRPADYDQKDIENEERNGNVVEESRLG
jgi:hypothetical protein